MNSSPPILVFGASGPVGDFLLQRLIGQGIVVMAISRHQPRHSDADVVWLQHDLDAGPVDVQANVLVSLGPLRHALDQVKASRRIGRVIALSSASTLFKRHSPDPFERELMAELEGLENELTAICQEREIDLTLLKSTMIYGAGRDANVARVSGLMAGMGLVPCSGRGLRQPVHADDLARLIVDCLVRGRQSAGCWLLGGGETLDYPAMLRRIGSSSGGRQVRVIPVPAWVMNLILSMVHRFGRLSDIRPAMIERQKLDLVVDDQPARERLGWQPRPFRP
jgi:nucleoside-diphosphate-sugar epimerase